MREFSKGFVLGAAIGGTLGVLFAPKKGSETRQLLKVYLNDVNKTYQRAKRDLSDFQEVAAYLTGVGLQKVKDTVSDIKASIDELSSNSKHNVESIQGQFDNSNSEPINQTDSIVISLKS